MTESYYPCYNWYISLVKRLMFTQFMHGTWVDDLSETSQKEKLGNVCIYYVDFFPLNVFHYSETRKLSSHFPMDKYNF